MKERRKVLIVGGDGFCGWPTALFLSANNYDVVIIDNLSRRKIDIELGVQSLTPIKPLEQRLRTWKEVSGNFIPYYNIDISYEYHELLSVINTEKPDVIVHLAEQKSAPYSMKTPKHKRYTVDKNLNATHNILCTIVESGMDIHLVHLGTTGVYGYGDADMKIPEGYLLITVTDPETGAKVEKEILYPADPGSIYHMTKTQDQLFFYYYNKNDGVRITDLHQGIVWGTQTHETKLHDDLINRFDYDGDFGTVLNRFLIQAAIGHPLTIYGAGGQTRAFININDTVRCIRLAIENPPQKGERVKIINQLAETQTVKDLAELISKKTGAEIQHIKNPRNEKDENDLYLSNDTFINLGWKPITLDWKLMDEIRHIAEKYAHRADLTKILPTSKWRKDI